MSIFVEILVYQVKMSPNFGYYVNFRSEYVQVLVFQVKMSPKFCFLNYDYDNNDSNYSNNSNNNDYYDS